MIKNEKQYAITRNKRDEFIKSLELVEKSNNNDLLNQIMTNSIVSQLETFDREIQEYEKLKNEKPTVIISSIENIPESLIKARIVRGLSQNDLAKKVGLKEQQIQRYESANYESANFERLLSIAKSMDIHFGDTKLIFNQEELKVDGYDPFFIREATNKLQSRGTLLMVQ